MAQRVDLSQHQENPINVTILGKNIDLTVPIKQYIMEKVEKVERMNHAIIEMAVRVDVQKLDHTVDITMKFSHFKINVHAVTLEMYSAIDKAFDKLKAKLRRWKGKIQDHHAKGAKVIDLEVNVLKVAPSELDDINDAIEEETLREEDKILHFPDVHKKKIRSLKTLTLQEAVMKMELSRDHFLIYKSEEDKELKILYRRKDDSYGIISLEKAKEG
jgi:putative sigma-54 modulation protein